MIRRAVLPNQGLFSHASAMQANLIDYLSYISKQGNLLKIPIPFYNVFLVNDPKLIETIFLTKSRSFEKMKNLKYVAGQIFGENLFTSDGNLWRSLRSAIQPGFSTQKMPHYSSYMINYTKYEIDSWKCLEAVDVVDFAMKLTLQITTRNFFGIDLVSSDYSEDLITSFVRDLVRFIEIFFTKITSIPVPVWLPTSDNIEIKNIHRRINSFLMQLICERRSSGEDRGDILSLLIQAQYSDESEVMSDQQMCNEAFNLFAAGYEVTAYTLAFTFYLISENPQVESLLFNEIDTVLGGQQVTHRDLPSLIYLEQTIKESMRLLPVTAVVSRQSIETVQFVYEGKECTLPKGSLVLVSPWALHRRSDLYPEPTKFDPTRFVPELEKKRHRMAYLPFSSGPRRCIGQGFAMTQMKINLAMILQKYRLSCQPGYEFEPIFKFNARPKNKMPMRLHKRGSGSIS